MVNEPNTHGIGGGEDSRDPIPLDRARPHTERALLIGTIAACVAFAGWFSADSFGLALVAISGWFFAGIAVALVRAAGQLRNGLLASPSYCREWHDDLLAVQRGFGLPDRRIPRLLIVQDPDLNASAWWWPGRPLLVVNSGLAAALGAPGDAALRRAILGHELAHTRWHQPWTIWTNGPTRTKGMLALLLLAPLQLVGLAWSRRAEEAADRVALLASGSLGAVAIGLSTVIGGVRPRDLAALGQQHVQQRAMRTGGLERAVTLSSTHPLLWSRLRAVATFACSARYAELAGKELAEQARWDASELGFTPDRAMAPSLFRWTWRRAGPSMQ
jgi:Zn-dependent protease with chaperone function